MNRKQQELYDETCEIIREDIGSFNAIAFKSVQITEEMITGETVRTWFTERKIPAEFVFVLYRMMNREIDPLNLLPWLRRWVTVK